MTEKRKKGRPPKYSKITFSKKVDEYVELRTKGNVKGLGKWPMTILDFCIFAWVYKDYVSEHNTWDGSKNDFSDSIKKLKTYCEHSLEYYTTLGKIPVAFAIFSLKNNYGWKEKNEVDIWGKDDKEITIKFIE